MVLAPSFFIPGDPMFKYSEINMNFEVTLYCAE